MSVVLLFFYYAIYTSAKICNIQTIDIFLAYSVCVKRIVRLFFRAIAIRLVGYKLAFPNTSENVRPWSKLSNLNDSISIRKYV